MRTLFFITSFLFILWQHNISLGRETSCANLSTIHITSEDESLAKQICPAAKRAIDFLAGFQLFPQRDIYIDIVEEAINNHGYIGYGSYDSRSDRIKLMSFDSIINGSKNPEMYGEPFDQVHYQGAVAHEIAHAVFHHNIKELAPGPVSQEYLAHATQLAVLPTERREAIIKRLDVEPWMSGDTISDIYMAFEPGRFAVKSYKHLTTSENPAAFVQILLQTKWFYVNVP